MSSLNSRYHLGSEFDLPGFSLKESDEVLKLIINLVINVASCAFAIYNVYLEGHSWIFYLLAALSVLATCLFTLSFLNRDAYKRYYIKRRTKFHQTILKKKFLEHSRSTSENTETGGIRLDGWACTDGTTPMGRRAPTDQQGGLWVDGPVG